MCNFRFSICLASICFILSAGWTLACEGINGDVYQHFSATLIKRSSPQFMQRLNTDSLEWKKWMSRRTDQNSNPIYLKNAREALGVFDEWFRNSHTDFKAMLDLMHLVSAAGLDGKSFYFSEGNSYSSRNIFPGIDREVLSHFDQEWVKAHFGTEPDSWAKFIIDRWPSSLKVAVSIFDFVQDQLNRKLGLVVNQEHLVYKQMANIKSPVPFAELPILLVRRGKTYKINATYIVSKISGNFKFNSFITWQTKVENLLSLENEISALSETHQVASVEEISLILKRGKSLMEQMRKAVPGKTSPSQIVELLARYYHVMINGHIYFRINNSILMNQVNYILTLHGLSALSHDDIDRWAGVLDTDEFIRYFKNEIDYQSGKLEYAEDKAPAQQALNETIIYLQRKKNSVLEEIKEIETIESKDGLDLLNLKECRLKLLDLNKKIQSYEQELQLLK